MGELGHLSVLAAEVLRLLEPAGAGLIVDCTTGLGGHSELLLDAAGPQARLIAIDVDESNLVRARRRLERFAGRARFFVANFSQVAQVLAEAGEKDADVLLADLGVASSQLDDPGRGLSFQAPGPLDMRLDLSLETTAADIVNTMAEAQLADIIYAYGEERYSRRVARAICDARKAGRIETTEQLSSIVVGAYPPPARSARRGVHPATRTFQALRIAVNDELKNLETLLASLPEVMNTGGRAGIISFHSLEDRLVKQGFVRMAESGVAEVMTRKPVTAGPQEIEANPRSRSAKLRVMRKTQAAGSR